MLPELFRLELTPATSLALFALFFAITLVIALRAKPKGTALGAAFPKALKNTFLATTTCGLMGSRDPKAPPESGPDLFIPGTLATLGGLLPLVISVARGPFELPVQSYPVAMAVGFVIVIWLSAVRLKARGFEQAHVLDVAIICIVAGPIGSRVFFVAQFWDDYFANRPATIASGPLVTPAKGDELVVKTGQGEARAIFQGDETTWEAVLARLAALEPAGVRAKLITLDRRKTENEIVHVVRGVALETTSRGTQAHLTVDGAAAVRLGLATAPEGVRGLDVPLAETLKLWNGGIVFYGGLIAATICSVIYLRWRKYPILVFADAVAPVMGIGLASGRVGCTLNGCCWGREVPDDFALGVHFPVGSFPWLQHVRAILAPSFDPLLDRGAVDAAHHLHAAFAAALPADLGRASHCVHPVQLYDAFGDLSLAALVYLFGRFVAWRDGQTFFLFYICYSISRFTSEHFRGDHGAFRWILGYPFTVSQIFSVVTLPAGIALFIWASRRSALSAPTSSPAEARVQDPAKA